MYLLLHNKKIAPFIRSTVDKESIHFVKTGKDLNGNISFEGNLDIMGHIHKGVLGIHIQNTQNIKINNTHIKNICNEACKINPNLLKYIQQYYPECPINFSNEIRTCSIPLSKLSLSIFTDDSESLIEFKILFHLLDLGCDGLIDCNKGNTI